MNMENFNKKCRESFRFLEDVYMCVVTEEENAYGVFITYLNKTTSVRISYEQREGGLFLFVSKLINGDIPEYPIVITQDSEINGFYLDDILSIRAPEEIKKFHEMLSKGSQSELAAELFFYASMLKKHAKDILLGNFYIFSELELIVKRRIANSRGNHPIFNGC